MKIDIVSGCDADFAQHLAVMLLSLADTNPQHSFSVFVLWNGSSSEKDKLREVLAGTPFEFSLIEVSNAGLSDLAVTGDITTMTYARLLMGNLLPLEIDRILYLDGDILVRGDVCELWTTHLQGRTIGAVVDLPRYPFNQTLGLRADALYFNAGVLLIDLRRWRERKIGERALTFAREHRDRLRWSDQCALNLVLQDDWTVLDRSWNFQSFDVAHVVNGHMRFDRVDPKRLANARLIHFNGTSKPWHYLNDHPLKGEYLHYRAHTAWPILNFRDRHPRNIARKYLLRYAPALLTAYGGLRKSVGWSD
jgi:lipopolysaccharide biosynthesis glycosyltransferase